MSPTPASPSPDFDSTDSIDLRDLFARLARGLAPTLGLAALGLVVAVVLFLATSPFVTVTTSCRVNFAFDGFSKGEYPDHTKFQPDDLRAADVVVAALKRLNLDASEETQSKIRTALSVEGIIPPYIVKERDRLRTLSQVAQAPFLPDEYLITLTLPRKFALSGRQRELLLNEIVTAFRAKFLRTYGALPLAFGDVKETLQDADLSDFEFVLTTELENIYAYLNQQVERAKAFRSPTTNMSFSDLLKQAELFNQIDLNETLGNIRLNNLSRDRRATILKMDFVLKTLGDKERLALEEEKTTREFLGKAEEHAHDQNYLFGVKSQVTRPRTEAPLVDQGLVDSLLANDTYSAMLRKALDASLAVKRIQAEEARIQERRKEMETAMREDTSDQSTLIQKAEASLKVTESAYDRLVGNIRKTHADFAAQQFNDAVRLSMEAKTPGKFFSLALYGVFGAFLGTAAGMGLSLLGICIGERKQA